MGCGQGFITALASFLISQCASQDCPHHASASTSLLTASYFLYSPGEEGGGDPWLSPRSQEASFLEAAATFSMSLVGISLGSS